MNTSRFFHLLFVLVVVLASAAIIGCPPVRDNGNDDGNDNDGTPVTEVEVPDVVGETQAAAQTAIANAGLSVGEVTHEHHATAPEGSVIGHAPAAGTSVAANSAVNLVVSLGLGDFLPPLDVGIVLDSDNSVSRVISRDGGSLETIDADGVHYLLTIPENALAQPTEITLTPVAAIDGFPFSGGLKAAAHMEPSGQVLFAPAILEATHADHPEPGMAAGFAYHADGEDFHLRPVEYDGDTARFHILHFSGAGHGSGTRQERQEQGQRLPASQQQAIDQAMADTLDEYTADQQRGEERELTDEERAAVFELLTAQYYNTVWARAMDALTAPPLLYCALQEYNLWRSTVDHHWDKLFPYFDVLTEMRLNVAQLLGQGFHNAIQTAAMDCSTGLDPRHAADMVAWHQAFMFSGLGIEGGAQVDWGMVETSMKNCLRFELRFEATGDAVGAEIYTEVSSGPHALLELVEYPEPPALLGDYRLEGAGALDFDSMNMFCLVNWTSTPGTIDVTAYLQLPARDVRHCPVLPAWEPLTFRVYVASRSTPMASVIFQCSEDDEPLELAPTGYWYAAWCLANLQRMVDYPQRYVFTEWNTAIGRNPIAWLNVTDTGPETTQAVTSMEIHHTPF